MCCCSRIFVSHPEEEKNDEAFARELASLCDLYVNDAFGAAHRAHASTAGITKFVEKAAAGLLMEKELEYLGRVIQNPEHPFAAILGGAKVSDKIPVINALIDRKVDRLLIGGAMAYTFFKAEGFTVGKSLVENDQLQTASEIKTAVRTVGRAVASADGSSSGGQLRAGEGKRDCREDDSD